MIWNQIVWWGVPALALWLAGALAAVQGIAAVKNGNGGEGGVRSLQEYHSLIK